MDPYAWSWNVEAMIAVPALTAAYVWSWRRYPAATWRKACFVGAMVLLLAITITPFETIALEFLLWVHLLQNVVLAEWAPLLIVLGVTPALAAELARPTVVRALTHPYVALPLWLANYVLWHVPAVYDEALRRPHSLLHLEHVAYVLTGVLMWWSVCHDVPHRMSNGGRAVYVFAGFLFSAPIGLTLALLPEPIYDFYVDVPLRLWGLSPLADQQLGGITMGVEQAIVFFAIFAYFFFRFLADQERHEDDDLVVDA